jgi:hypothetical protein
LKVFIVFFSSLAWYRRLARPDGIAAVEKAGRMGCADARSIPPAQGLQNRNLAANSGPLKLMLSSWLLDPNSQSM